MKIFLIGMPGSGKTTLGKQLASHLMVDFVDLDAEIEKAEEEAISMIFRKKGEEYFRILEAKLLREWAGGNRDFIMATGGGAPCFFNGMEIINECGVTIFLDVAVPTLVARVKANRERPLLLADDEAQLTEKLTLMRAKRLQCYQQAQITVADARLDVLLRRLQAKS